VLDEDGLTVSEEGREVALTPREVLLLRYLLQRPGRVVTRPQLLTVVWGWQYTGDDRTVDVHVSRLRRKLPSLTGRLVAIRNVGYRLDLEELPSVRVANS
jgi:DNA-binding response OmpR family regulator